MSEFKIIETQEELDKILSNRLKREQEKFQNQLNELITERDLLKTQLAEKTTELETGTANVENLNKTIAELTGKVGKYELESLKTSIALKNGIPYDLAARLTGTNEEELTQDAIKLAEYINKPSIIAPLKNSEPKGNQFEGREAQLLAMSKNLTNKGE